MPDIRLSVIAASCLLLSGLALAEVSDDVANNIKVETEIVPVGMSSRDFEDSDRNQWGGEGARPLATTLWYPTDATQSDFEITIGNPEDPLFIAGKAQGNPPISEDRERYPLILLSHGTGGASMHLMWLATRLAENGYIVAAVNHHGNTSAGESYRPEGFMLWWERTRDLSVVLDHLFEDPVFGDHIDGLRVGAAGFSLGGYTVISLAGGITSLQAFGEFCASRERDPTCEVQAEYPGLDEDFLRAEHREHVRDSFGRHDESWRDDRFAAVYAIAPALGGAFTERGLMPIVVPVGILGAEGDHVAPMPTNAERFARYIEGARLDTIADAGHYSFLSRCTDTGRKRLQMLCRESAEEREEIHDRAAQKVIEFFDRHLNSH
jgi:predicted dienelactone hydrolase